MSLLRSIDSPLLLLAVASSLPACTRQPEVPCECPPAAEAEPSAEQTGEEDAKHYALPGLDHGLVQSPVNILSGKAVGGEHKVGLHFDHADPDSLANTGHSIQLDFPRGSSIIYDGKEYDLKQLHFHTPSEHLIDGVTFPMEMHIVNMKEPKTPDDPPEYLVIGVLFRMGDKSEFIASFLGAVPTEEGEKELSPGQVYLDELRHEGGGMPEFFHYRGSLTTPPHTETVQWLIVKKPMEASPEQIRRINFIEGDNARHVQALYDRAVED